MVPVLSRSRVCTSPAASTARPLMASTLRWTRRSMDRLVQRNVLAMSRRAVEAAGDVQTLLLDKTGTITLGNRMASAFVPVEGHDERQVADAAQLASLADETPEGRSIVVLAKERFEIRERELAGQHTFVPFT